MLRMRVEPYGVDSFVHVVKRGARGLPIVSNELESQRFLRLLYYMNDSYLDPAWDRMTAAKELFSRPGHWKTRQPLVEIHAFTLMPNHIHILLKEINEGGITTFMRKICQSMTNYHNEKYQQKGSLFQGPYRGRTIDTDVYFKYVAVYIMVKNVFELYPKGGLRGAIDEFEEAWQWAFAYPYSSLAWYAGIQRSPISEHQLLNGSFASATEFKKFSRDVIRSGKWLEVEFN